jgi:GDPmannose 4,6-dehydratase
MAQKRALILGVSGQDGAYLAQLLLGKGYEVVGTSRDAEVARFDNLSGLGIHDLVHVESVAVNDFRSVLQVIAKAKPDEIYNLAGQSSVGLSFQQPVETLESISVATLNVLEAMRFIGQPIRFYNACSSECFGDTGSLTADETTPFRPRSPYAMAKAAAYWQVANYREAYKLFACSGILFNHESPLRPERFVTKKIVAAACRIKAGSKEKLRLGNLAVQRDWGWAPEYVAGMWAMLQQEAADDFVLATGATYPLEQFVAHAFTCVNLEWREHVIQDIALLRPTDLKGGKANPAKAARQLAWSAKNKMPEVVRLMVDAELKAQKYGV